MKATGIVRRIDDLGRVVIPKEIRRTLRIREGEPSHTTLTQFDKFYIAIHSVVERYTNSYTLKSNRNIYNLTTVFSVITAKLLTNKTLGVIMIARGGV